MQRVEVAPEVYLDRRLALIHPRSGWLAVADLHYGFSNTMCAAGGLFPIWGDQTLEERLSKLCEDYSPSILIITGDLVHGRVNRTDFSRFLDHLNSLASQVVLIEGNHDRSPTVRAAPFVESFQHEHFFFHHGHLDLQVPDGCVEVTGHWHPATSIRDGAGLSLKLPTFVQERDRWILPAFSPWTGGSHWKVEHNTTRRWICSSQHIMEWDDSKWASPSPT